MGDDLCRMDRRLLAVASFALLVAVALGAFGAHGLRARLSADALSQWHTGVQYHFHHALGLLALAALIGRFPEPAMRLAAWLFGIGIIAFSGSLYLLSTRDLIGSHGLVPVLGPITPIGGLCFIGGWLVLLITALRRHDRR